MEDLEQQRRPLLGDEDCRRWKPGCSCSSSDNDDDNDEEEEEEGVSIGRIVRITLHCSQREDNSETFNLDHRPDKDGDDDKNGNNDDEENKSDDDDDVERQR